MFFDSIHVPFYYVNNKKVTASPANTFPNIIWAPIETNEQFGVYFQVTSYF